MKPLVLVIGRRGLGKTTLAYELAEEQAGRTGRIVVYDIKGDFRAWPGSTFSDIDSFEMALARPDLLDVKDAKVLVYRPEDDEFKEFGPVARLVKEYAEGPDALPTVFLIDEAWMLQENAAVHEELSRLQRLGDRGNLSIIETAHRPVDFARRTRAIASHWYLFQVTEDLDLQAVAERCGAQAAEACAKLKGHEYMAHDVGAGTTKVCAPLSSPRNVRGDRRQQVEEERSGIRV